MSSSPGPSGSPPRCLTFSLSRSRSAKALSTFMGHANIGITLDRYGHLMPGSEEEAAGLLDTYLATQRERAEEQARAAVA